MFWTFENATKAWCLWILDQQNTLKNTCKIQLHNMFSLWCLANTVSYFFSVRAQKFVLGLGIHSLNPQNNFPYPGYNSGTIRTTLKNHSKSSPWFLQYFTFRKASKGLKMAHFWTRFLRFSRFWVMISKIALRGETTSQSTTKNIISVMGLLL